VDNFLQEKPGFEAVAKEADVLTESLEAMSITEPKVAAIVEDVVDETAPKPQKKTTKAASKKKSSTSKSKSTASSLTESSKRSMISRCLAHPPCTDIPF